MTWWGMVLVGVFWCASVVLVTALSFSGAEQAVEDGLASDPTSGQMAVAVISAIVFAIPGIGFIAFGLRKRQRSPRRRGRV